MPDWETKVLFVPLNLIAFLLSLSTASILELFILQVIGAGKPTAILFLNLVMAKKVILSLNLAISLNYSTGRNSTIFSVIVSLPWGSYTS